MSSSTETSSLAYVFNTPAAEDDDEMYPFLPDDQDELPLSPSDQALLMGVYPATMSDFDFNATIQAATAPQQTSFYSNGGGSSNGGSATGSPMPNLHELQISANASASERSKMPGLLPPSMLNDPQYQHLHHHHQQYQQMQQQQQQQYQQSLPPPPPQAPNSGGGYEFDPRSLQAFTTKPARKASSSSSPNYSPLSNPESDIMRDSEEILNAPVKSLTEEEKKLRRRAQVAKSARKHRNRQKVRIDPSVACVCLFCAVLTISCTCVSASIGRASSPPRASAAAAGADGEDAPAQRRRERRDDQAGAGRDHTAPQAQESGRRADAHDRECAHRRKRLRERRAVFARQVGTITLRLVGFECYDSMRLWDSNCILCVRVDDASFDPTDGCDCADPALLPPPASGHARAHADVPPDRRQAHTARAALPRARVWQPRGQVPAVRHQAQLERARHGDQAAARQGSARVHAPGGWRRSLEFDLQLSIRRPGPL